ATSSRRNRLLKDWPGACVASVPMLAERLAAQLLAGPPARDPVAVAERLLAVQAQDPRGARLAIRARTTGLTAADVDRALTDDRSLVVSWLNRGTLHLVRSEDYGWLHALTTPQLLTGNTRRLAQEGVSPDAAERGVATIVRSLADEGPLTRDELRARVDAAGLPTRGQALVHLLMLASLRGLTLRGPMRGGRHAYVLVRDWLGEPAAVDRDTALAELARRYLAGHGPADDRDLARWAGVPLRDARAGLRGVASEVEERGDGLADLRGRPPADALRPPRGGARDDPLRDDAELRRAGSSARAAGRRTRGRRRERAEPGRHRPAVPPPRRLRRLADRLRRRPRREADAARARGPDRQRGTGPPASTTIAPTALAASSVATTPRLSASRSTAAPARTPHCHASESARVSGIAEPRMAPIAAGPAPSRNARARGSVRSRSKLRPPASTKANDGVNATAAASS